jgi:hypothetical protein
MNAIEIAAVEKVSADGGVLSPLRMVSVRGPVSCYCAADMMEMAMRAGKATAINAMVMWAQRALAAARAGGRVGHFHMLGDAAAPSANLSVAELTAVRSSVY